MSEQAWTAEKDAAARALIGRVNRALSSEIWSEMGPGDRAYIVMGLVDLLEPAVAELSRLQAENVRLRAVMEAARQVHTVGSTEGLAEEDVWMQAFYGLHHALRAYDAQTGGQS